MKALTRTTLAAGLMAGIVFGQGAQAATATATMPVTATVLAACIVVALPLAFGNYTGAQNDATSTITVTCTPGTAYNVRLDAGASAGATVTTRAMTSGTAKLNYSLFRDTARTQNWGITDGTDSQAGSGSGLPQLLTVYGRIPASQFVTTGAYTDLVGVTLAY